MNKILPIVTLLLICLNFSSNIAHGIVNYPLITDSFAEEYLNNKIISEPISSSDTTETITDTFSEKILSSNIVFVSIQKPEITDKLITDSFIKKHKNETYTKEYKLTDSFAENRLCHHKSIVYPRKKYNFLNINKLAVKIKPKNYFSTKMQQQEGDILDFIVIEDVKKEGNVIIPQNSTIKGRIETISPNMAKGVPADLTIGNFNYKNIEFSGTIKQTGARRYYWIAPIAFVLNTVFFGTGYPMWIIRGGHAKIKPNQIFEIFISE